jgi:hypothetical protein
MTKTSNMKTKIAITLGLLLVLGMGTVSAQYANGKHKQKARIAQGVRSGELNRFETKKLVKEQRRLHRHTRRAKLNDGHISPRESRMLKHERNRADRHIYRYKHNRFDRK